MLRDKTNELNDLYNRYREFEIEVQRKDSTINELQNKLKLNEQEMHQFRVTIKRVQSELEESNGNINLIRDYEARLQLLSKEIERLNEVLRRKVDENSKLVQKVSDYEY